MLDVRDTFSAILQRRVSRSRQEASPSRPVPVLSATPLCSLPSVRSVRGVSLCRLVLSIAVLRSTRYHQGRDSVLVLARHPLPHPSRDRSDRDRLSRLLPRNPSKDRPLATLAQVSAGNFVSRLYFAISTCRHGLAKLIRSHERNDLALNRSQSIYLDFYLIILHNYFIFFSLFYQNFFIYRDGCWFYRTDLIFY